LVEDFQQLFVVFESQLIFQFKQAWEKVVFSFGLDEGSHLGLNALKEVFDGKGIGVGFKAQTQVFLSRLLEQFLLDNQQWNR
jgi:hypothetical protein